MVSMQFANTAFALLPPVVAILMAVITRRVLLSLGVGILLGALMYNGFAPMATLSDIADRAIGLVIDDGALESWNVPLIGFLFVLGMTIAVINVTGAAKAFARWARQRVKTRRDARLMTMMLGFIIFIDDYFNTLAVGSVAKPVADDHKISREELAYGVDSTAAPVCVMAPISSWGAYIVGLIGTVFAAREITEFSALNAFLQMIPMNLYALTALALLACVIVFNLQIGPMAKAAQRATETGELWDDSKGLPPGADLDLPEADNGSIWGLLLPILALVASSVYFMLATGAANLGDEPFTVMAALENTDTTIALFYAALVSLVVALATAFYQKLTPAMISKALISGAKSMLPAVYILLFAWTIAGVIRDLGTGTYLASLVQTTMPMWCLPVLIFLLSGVTAFATGTSWGTFAIMLPIAADIAIASEMAMLLPLMAAVLAGAVFGDHCSPISDTTVLSGTGAGCHHIDHVSTQLPYAVSAALIAGLGYLAIGITHSAIAGFLVSAVALTVWVLVMRSYCDRTIAMPSASQA
ncbi:transporter, NhaC family [Ferrimonas balearica DSM 9799]|uniref:Transporter, NhaC family n=1 Tax=Ferrimonas balearica (strain DSM 9799 / CCM 4581 / KCTC 23876 / PAT) TaxID=550540 RepID=E1SU44_FERBD|nr:Na+/H+ antiporter NhaC family protein [Ferrimonas balearica]ADN75191.1 transporter, NhaC family [Ferrimonas balearica DSM 9799]MBW3138087.1 Na+/H+ antiporter NhaC family protein [Ferrimonas balearica]MBW3164346.1 Na+/H+ antiporter NhaC family protein [Ferrimonas balearica]MBY5978854.1 Na+/H+ antiporter NhaC family protein [Ferrimonas balearica]MBY6105165.1 Na+/H+ antiporter NhaC family protein [Ferrimonas balearica]